VDHCYLSDPRYYFLSVEKIPYNHYVTSENVQIKVYLNNQTF